MPFHRSRQLPQKGPPRWPVRAVGGAHFAPPTHRTRRDGLDHGRSVPLPVALGGDDYAFVPPAAPSSRTDRLRISVIPLTLASIWRLRIEASDATMCK